MLKNQSRYYLAVSVGPFLASFLEDTTYNGKSFRFYSDQENKFFDYPYLLCSAAHNYKKENFRNNLGFPEFEKGNSNLFSDSGGYQLAMGSIKEEKYNDAIAFKWSEANADIFPILDRPIYVTNKNTGAKNSSEHFNECLKKSAISAKYYLDNRTRPDAKILNVMHGRDITSLSKWYQIMSKFKFEGWAGGGTNSIVNMLRTIYFLKEKGEFDRDKPVYYHIFGVSKIPYIVYISYVQYLFNKANIPLIISYDSSYPCKTAAFGNYFLFTSPKGISQLSFSNKYKDMYNEKLTLENQLPCSCVVCSSVKDVKEYLIDPKLFYNITSLHNLCHMIDYKRKIENIVLMDIDELLQTSLTAEIYRNLQIIKKSFDLPFEQGMEYLSKELVDFDASPIHNSEFNEMF